MRKLIIANPKGGVGKTTTTLNLGAALAARGQRVLLVDLDPQAGLTLALLRQSQKAAGVYALVTRQIASVEQAIQQSAGCGCDLLPACAELAHLEARLATRRDAIWFLRSVLREVETRYDLILVDTPPGIGLLTANALAVGDMVIITVQAHLLAMYGVRALMGTIRHVQEHFNPALMQTRLLVTMIDSRVQVSSEVVDELRAVFPQETLTNTIPFSAAVIEAQVASRSVLAYAPDDLAARAYVALAEEIGAHD